MNSAKRDTVAAIEAEFQRYKALAAGAIRQLDTEKLAAAPLGGNSIATLVWHIAGNLRSRFTDFLTTDGEKPWRNRESEFEPRHAARDALMDRWEEGWETLFSALSTLTDTDLDQSVLIRGVTLSVREALLRSLAHVSYHVGQIVYIARGIEGAAWTYLSIPPGGSDAYNRDPGFERAADHAASVPTTTEPDAPARDSR